MAATVCVAPDKAVAGLEYVVRVDSKALERVQERRKDGDGAVLAGLREPVVVDVVGVQQLSKSCEIVVGEGLREALSEFTVRSHRCPPSWGRAGKQPAPACARGVDCGIPTDSVDLLVSSIS